MTAQKLSVGIGPEIKIDRAVGFWGHLHANASGHYVLLTETTTGWFGGGTVEPILQKYDRNFNLVFSKEIQVDDKDINFGNMLYGKGHFLFCTQQLDKSDRKATFHVTKIGMDGKTGKPAKVATVTYKEKNDLPNFINWRISDDSTKLLLATLADDNDDDLSAKTAITVMDNHAEKIWAKGFTLPYSQEQLTLRSWTVSNNGDVYMLAKVFDERRSKSTKKVDGKKVPAYRMIIFHFKQGIDTPKEYVLGLNNSFVTDVTFKLSPQNDLYCAGFYSNDTKGVLQGVFFTRINGATGEVTLATKKEISDKDLANLDTSKDRSGDKGLESSFEFNNLIVRSDGSIVMLAEDAYFYTSTYRVGNSWVTRTTYVNNEVFVGSISAEGIFEWVRVVPKKQIFEDTRVFSGYSYMIDDQNLYILYNDDEDNLDRKLTEKARRISSFRDAVASVVTIDRQGEMKRKKLFDAKEDADALMAPGNSRQIGPEELFFTTTRFKLLSKKRMRLGLMEVKK